jgi:hypoxanthine phosphoribosyltransferase
MIEKLQVTQHDIKDAIEHISSNIVKSKVNVTSVVGIQRGGLHLSMPLAESLGIKHKSIKIRFYSDGDERAVEPEVCLLYTSPSPRDH